MRLKILVIDNYDSFTFNLVQLLKSVSDANVDVYRNDEIELDKINKYDKILLSPGPGLPKKAGILIPIIKEYASTKSILGVCLGHQAIAESFGGKLINLTRVFHGVSTSIKILNNNSIFNNLGNELLVGRYHSWVVSEEDFPNDLEITAIDENNLIMAFQHKRLNVQAVQFHPESILTPNGEMIIKNWLNL